MAKKRDEASEQPAEKVRLGGMALGNGVLVHGPTSWACAVRTDDGRLKVVAERKRLIGSRVTQPLLRGPARLAESFAVLPRLKRALPEARLPFEGGTMVASTAGAAVALHGIRRSRLSTTSQELVAGLLAIAPALLALRGGSLAGYHGAEHIAIGSYEHDAPDRQGARALRRSPRRAAARDDRARQPARRARARPTSGRRHASPRRWAPSPLRPRSSAGCSGTPSDGSPAPSRGRATSCSTGSRQPSRARSSSKSPRRRSPPASSSKRSEPLPL